MLTDPIADMLIRMKNGYQASKLEVVVPYSKVKETIALILKRSNYLQDVKVHDENEKKELLLYLKYKDGKAAIEGITRISKPGCRVYKKCKEIPVVLSGFGICIVSTSRGIMLGHEARKKSLGGEVLCEVW